MGCQKSFFWIWGVKNHSERVRKGPVWAVASAGERHAVDDGSFCSYITDDEFDADLTLCSGPDILGGHLGQEVTLSQDVGSDVIESSVKEIRARSYSCPAIFVSDLEELAQAAGATVFKLIDWS